jgi:hypothetical protein
MLHEGSEVQGKYGKQGWLIVRRFIAVAMDQGGSAMIAYTDVGGRAPKVGALRRRRSCLPGAARFLLTNLSGTNLNSSAGPKGGGQDARSNSFRYKLYLLNDTKLTSN